ncbi:MAG: hypothetical protein ACXWPM_06825 [Bdellovibrionota bacterium]
MNKPIASCLLVLIMALGASACTSEGYDSPESVLLLARNALATGSLSKFQSALIGDAQKQWGTQAGFELLAKEAQGRQFQLGEARETELSEPSWMARNFSVTILEKRADGATSPFREATVYCQVHRMAHYLGCPAGQCQDLEGDSLYCQISSLK